jgi:halocyanin-like protein
MSGSDAGDGPTRRGLLRGLAGSAGVLGATGAASGAPAEGGEVDYQGWFGDVSNFEGTVDRRGESSVTVRVGVEGNTSFFAFGPPAIRVDPGTEVVWEWTGRGGAHNVVDLEGSFESELSSEEGFSYSRTFDTEGIWRYYCGPHRSFGMKGAVVVGDAMSVGGGGGGISWSPPGTLDHPYLWMLFGSLGLGALAVLAADAYLGIADWRSRREATADVESTEADAYDPAVEIDHEEYDPTGTAALIVLYFLILVVMWVFVYFVEFLGGPTVVG